MKRGNGPKRSGLKRKPEHKGLTRDKGLHVNPEKVREFLRRGRENRNVRDPLPAEVRRAAMARSHGRCIGCGAEEPDAARTLPYLRHQPHHVFPVRLFPELELVAACVVMLCATCHANAEFSAFKRLPLAALPAETIALADGHPDRRAHLDRTYPRDEA